MGLTGKDIGDIVEIYCLRCRLNLDASVSALVGGVVVKCTCRTCGNEVKYKAPVDEKLKKKKALEKLMRMRNKKLAGMEEKDMRGPSALRQLWDEMTDKVDVRYSRSYSETDTYSVEDAIRHKGHGLGIVQNIDGDGTLNILFRKGFVELPSGIDPDEEQD